MIDFFIKLFDGNIYLFLLVVPFLGQLGLPTGAMFFLLYAGSQTASLSNLLILFFIVTFAEIFGDLLAYFIGSKFLEIPWIEKLLHRKKIKYLFERGKFFMNKDGDITVFLTRFLVTGIGPYVNYVAAVESYKFRRFIVWVILGEMIYASEMLLLGYFFKETFEEIITFFTNFSLLIVIGVLLLYIGRRVFKKAHAGHG